MKNKFISAVFLVFSICFTYSGDKIGLDMMIGQMFIVGFRGTEVDERSTIVTDIKNRNLGGVILFDHDLLVKGKYRNIMDKGQIIKLTAALQSVSKVPLFVAVDQEGGRVARLGPQNGFEKTPSAEYLGALDDPEVTKNQGRTTGVLLKTLGINLDLAPVVDININPDNPAIGRLGRSFSSDGTIVVKHASAFIEGLNESGVLSCIKHFPGLGSAHNDTHYMLTDITATWSDRELLPFGEIIAGGNCNFVMTSHVYNRKIDGEHPATLSKKFITDILRKKLKYDGIVITDDLQMAGISIKYDLEKSIMLSINAGADILLFGNNLVYDPEILKKAVKLTLDMIEKNKITRTRIEESYKRIMDVKKKYFGYVEK